MRSIFEVSHISYYVKFPRIRSYHAAFFHGVANRNGEWFPFDTLPLSPPVTPLTVWYNRYRIPNYCKPGSWPVVSKEFRTRLEGLSNISFYPIKTGKVVDYPWEPGKPIQISPDNLTRRELFERLDEVDSSNLEPRFEMVVSPHQLVARDFKSSRRLKLLIGTPPGTKECTFIQSDELNKQFPVHWFEGAIMLVEQAWEKVRDLIDSEFYIVREYDLQSGKLIAQMGPAEESTYVPWT